MTLWDLKAGVYHAVRRAALIRKFLDQETGNLKSLVELPEIEVESILDIGVGSGSSWGIFPRGATGYGIDRSHAMLRQARKRIPGLHPAVADALELPVANQKVEFVSMIGMTEYVRNKAALLDEILRALKPDGWLLITIPARNLLNRMRNALGNPVYIIGQIEWESLLQTRKIRIAGKKRSLLQIQYLLQRK